MCGATGTYWVVLPQDLSVGLILNGYTSDFAGFVRNYNMHNMRKTVGELHALLIEYEKDLPKKAATPQVMAIQEHPVKDDTCHHYKEVGHWKRNCPVYLAELIKKKKQVGNASSLVSKNDVLYFNAISREGIYEIDMFNLVPNVNSIYNVSNKRVKHNLDSTYLWHYRLAHISKKRIEKRQHDMILKSTDDESFDQCVSCLPDKMTRKPFSHRTERATDLLGLIHTDVWGYEALLKQDTPNKLQQRSVKCIFIGYPKETIGYYFYFPPENKIVVVRYVDFLEKNLLSQEVSGRAVELEEIQDEDTPPSDNTSKIPMKVEGFKPPLEEVIPVHNQVWRLVDLSPNDKTVRSKWFFKKKTDMDGIVNTYKAHLVAKGFTHTSGVDYEETFSLVADIRAIRILKAIAAGSGIYSWNQDRSKRLIRPSQNAYLNKILKRFRMYNSKRGNIPIQERLDLNKTQGALTLKEVKRMQNVPYVSAVGSIIFEIDRDDIKPQTGYVFVLNGGAVDWKSSKQSTTTMSATEAEYIAASEAAMEVVWISKFISGLGIVPTINHPIKMFYDNSAALLNDNEPRVQKGDRHYHRRYHYVRECIELGEINLLKVHTDNNLANLFTKALPQGKLTQHARS
nr:hypothetical protein [Tanacetum cinerariifolium]